MSNEKSSLKSCFFHFLLYLCGTQIPDASLMGVVKFTAELEFALIHLNANALVGIPERHTIQNSSVYLLYSKQIHIFRIIQNILIYRDVLKHIFCHEQAFVHLLKSREKHILKELVVPVVSMGHVCGHQAYLIREALYSVAQPSEDFPYIRILFMRHYA